MCSASRSPGLTAYGLQISEYIGPLIASVQSLKNPLYLQAIAATFAQLMRLPPELMAIRPKSARLTLSSAQHVIFDLFEPHMDDYLSEETDYAKSRLESICEEWSSSNHADAPTRNAQVFVGATGQNAALAKRNFVSSFTKALMLPVTIVPKTVGAVTVGAFNAVAQIGSYTMPASGTATLPADVTDAQEDTVASTAKQLEQVSVAETSAGELNKMQSLLSLDLALELVQAALDSLKRVQSFAVYPPEHPIGAKVRDTIEEVFISLLENLTSKHIVPAFTR